MRGVFLVFLIANVLLLAFGQQWLGVVPPAQAGRDPARVTQQLRPAAISLGTPVDVDGVDGVNAAALAGMPLPTAPQTTAAPTVSAPASPTQLASTSPEPTGTALADTASDAAASPAATVGVQTAALAAPAMTASCVEWGSFGDTELAQALVWLSARFPQLTVNTRRGEEAQSWMVRIPPLRNAAAAQARATALRQQGVEDIFVFQDPGPNQHALSLGMFRTEDAARRLMASLHARQIAGVQIVARSNIRTWLTLRPISAQVRDGLEAGRATFPTHTLRNCQA